MLNFDNLLDLKNDFRDFKAKERKRIKDSKSRFKDEEKEKSLSELGIMEERGLECFLRKKMRNYFTFIRKSYGYTLSESNEIFIDEKTYKDLKEERKIVDGLINLKYISAKREVSNKEVDNTLSVQTSKIYEKIEKEEEQEEAIEKFENELGNTDVTLTKIYDDIFNQTVERVRQFGGIRVDDSVINITSTLEHRQLLKGNTTVIYNHQGANLPENLNGLGYMNLISMIFEIEITLLDFLKSKKEKPADINLFFIEEPEAHTHPQMQYIFIQNIKDIITENCAKLQAKHKSCSLQYVISTHSSHIVSNSDFEDIKYLKKESENSVISKNLKDLQKSYETTPEGKQAYRFLKHYLTLNRAELFFADKAILFEGDTERILLPAMMKKIDQDDAEKDKTEKVLPLLSQNISLVEVGAYSHIFERFIDFIGIKTLIITDLDSYYSEPVMEDDKVTQKKYKNGKLIFTEKKCVGSDLSAQYTRNTSLQFFHKNNTKDNSCINYYNNLTFDWKILRKKKDKGWVSNRKANLLVCFQTREQDIIARSFEDAFFKINKEFIVDENNQFDSLIQKWIKEYRNDEIDSFKFSENAVVSKPSLAIEILLNSKSDPETKKDFINWNTPSYIKEGLSWLKKN